MVPDVAGWKAERFIWEENQNPISVAPDWIGEVLSQSTLRLDRVKKMAKYAEYSVNHLFTFPRNAWLPIIKPFRAETNPIN